MQIIDNSDKSWDYFGKTNPYFGVITSEHFRQKNLNYDAKVKFFESGKNHIDRVMKIIHEHLVPDFKPNKALDFGCGVGRLVIPLASICDFVTGVDVSDAMLKEAEQNSQIKGLSNVEFIKSDDSLSKLSGKFNFIHSYIVFQHIPPNRGKLIVQKLINLLEYNGVGVLHFTYHRNSSILLKILYWARKSVPLFNSFLNLILKRPFNYPIMQMNEYDLGQLFQLLQNNDCHHTYVHFSRHSSGITNTDGVIIFFKKQSVPYW